MAEEYEMNSDLENLEDYGDFDPADAVPAEEAAAIELPEEELENISGGAGTVTTRFKKGSLVYYYRNGYYYPGVVQAVILSSPYFHYVVTGNCNGKNWRVTVTAAVLCPR